jgi:hypothetical protein
MKTFLADIIPKIERFSKKLDDLTLLTNQHWVCLNDILNSKTVYIFRGNNQLLISDNGIVQKGSWEYLGNQSLLLDTNNQSYLLKQGFFDENVIALKLDSSEQFAFFVNETKYDKELNNIHDILMFLENKYLKENNFQTRNEVDNLKYGQRQYLSSKKLPKPNMWVENMLLSNDTTLINTTINWRQFCDSHSKYYPLYSYQELIARGVIIPNKLEQALNEYANWMGHSSFDKMAGEYFD